MELYRVYPHIEGATEAEPGHPLFANPDYQGFGRFDNPDRYAAIYVASTGSGAIGEVFQSAVRWDAGMLPHPSLPGSERRLATFLFDEERHQLCNLDNAQTLVELGVRPSDVVRRDRHVTQRLARDVHAQGRFAGITYWSNVRPQWVVHVIWDDSTLELVDVERLPGHKALLDANERLFKPKLHKSLRRL